jgi:hypothetical protein
MRDRVISLSKLVGNRAPYFFPGTRREQQSGDDAGAAARKKRKEFVVHIPLL